MQLPNGPFGPIPSSVVLNASGTGTITFQPNGKNARITNLFGNVSSTTNQAVVSVYRGQVADSNRVFNNNSGSTGFTASGYIDVKDGETLYVQWVGGTPGATAYATFSGTTLVPFDQSFGGFSMRAEDPIAAGDGSLVFPALKSPNYVAGSTGWRLARNGDIEVNNGVFRGTLTAGNNVVIIDSTGVRVNQPGGDTLYMNVTEGFIIDAVSGAFIQIEVDTLTGVPRIVLRPPTSNIAATYSDSFVRADYLTEGGGYERPYLQVFSPNVNSGDRAELTLYGENTNGDSPFAVLNSRLIDQNGVEFAKGLVSWGADFFDGTPVGTTETTVLTIPSTTYRAGRAYRIESYGKYSQSVAALTQPIARFRKTSATGLVLCDKGRWNFPAVTTTIGQDLVGKFFVGASDVTATIVMTLQTQVNTLTQRGDANGPRNVYVYDIGESADYPDFPELV